MDKQIIFLPTKYSKQKHLWLKFYLIYNDDNLSHAKNCFDSNNYETVEQLLVSNARWITEILNRGVTKKEILNEIPDAEELFNFIESHQLN